MKYISTNQQSDAIGFREALFKGLAPDKGLYLPKNFPQFDPEFFKTKMTYVELASQMIHPFVSEYISFEKLKEICSKSFSFDLPLIKIKNNLHVLELFHGPTLAFKDFAARFMARCMQYLLEKDITILVATSGDTGGAVANGFFGVDGIRVIILYPSKRVSQIQEKQLTTYGGNIFALEVEGNFDDCQKMVKEAFLDKSLRGKISLGSANSINIARLLPQSTYYAWAYNQIKTNIEVVFSIPSGNFGNLTGGIIAKRMGMVNTKFIASTNTNNVFSRYLNTGNFAPVTSKKTISNAMDVGKPSNFERLLKMYDGDINKIKTDLFSWSFSDNKTEIIIREIENNCNYLVDPHTAIGILGMNKFKENINKNNIGIVLATAHPAKFQDIVEPIIKKSVQLPDQLQKAMEKEKNSIVIPPNYSFLRDYLIQY